jgi:hypothetical protein
MASPLDDILPLSPPVLVRDAGSSGSDDSASRNPSGSSSASPMDEDVDVLQHERAALTETIGLLKEELAKLGKYS